jgi:hypothetical protein
MPKMIARSDLRSESVMAQRYRCRRRGETAECEIRASELSYTCAVVAADHPVLESEADHVAKIQGEGDYESARRYNSRTRKFVAKKGATAKRATGGVDAGALRKAKSKSKAGGQDARDAKVFKTLESKRGKAARRSGARA